MKRALAAALLAVAAALPAQAGSLVDVSVTDLDTGQTLPLYPADGRYYVAGTPGHRYAISLNNKLSERVMTVLSVDGVNAVSGQTAGALQSGYVLDPWERAEVRGWRKDLSQVAEFVFTALPDSYAARTGRPQNVGVIGVAVFREARPVRPPPMPMAPPVGYDERESRDRAAAEAPRDQPARAAEPSSSLGVGGRADSYAKSAPAPMQERKRQELGTGHGQRRYDPVGTTAFQRARNTPDEVISIYYDDYDSLADRGVVPPRCCYPTEPEPFPVGFVPDPWR